MTTTTKIDDVARVTSFEPCDHPRPGAIMRLTLLGTGECLVWLMNSLTQSSVGIYAPVAVGDVIAIQASRHGDRLKRVRYSNRGRQFRGDAWHNKQHRAAN